MLVIALKDRGFHRFIGEQSLWEDKSDDSPDDILPKPVALSFAVALVAGYWLGAGQHGSRCGGVER